MNWKHLSMRLLLNDQTISLGETEILQEEFLADNHIGKEELEFLQELRRQARVLVPEFDQFFFRVVKKVVLADGVISDADARWLRELIWADNTVNRVEAEFLRELKNEAHMHGPEFSKLYRECFEKHEWHRER